MSAMMAGVGVEGSARWQDRGPDPSCRCKRRLVHGGVYAGRAAVRCSSHGVRDDVRARLGATPSQACELVPTSAHGHQRHRSGACAGLHACRVTQVASRGANRCWRCCAASVGCVFEADAAWYGQSRHIRHPGRVHVSACGWQRRIGCGDHTARNHAGRRCRCCAPYGSAIRTSHRCELCVAMGALRWCFETNT